MVSFARFAATVRPVAVASAASLVASVACAQEVDNWLTSRGVDVFDFIDAGTITRMADGSRTAWVTVVLTGEKQR